MEGPGATTPAEAQAVELMLDPSALARALPQVWREEHGWSSAAVVGTVRVRWGETSWVSYLRPGGPGASIQVLGYSVHDADGSASSSVPDAVELPGTAVRVLPFPRDRRLSVLDEVLRGDALAAVGFDPARVRRETVHYRPEERAVIRVRSDGPTSYVRVRNAGAVERELELMTHLDGWLRAAPDVRVPRVEGVLARGCGIVLGEVPGEPLSRFLKGEHGPQDTDACARVGRAIARFHAVPPLRQLPARRRAEHRELAASALGRMGAVAGTTPAIRAMLDVVSGEPEPPEGPDTLLHGGLHAGNPLVAPDRVGLIDFDGAAFGEAEADLGKLLGGLAIRGRAEQARSRVRAAISGYEVAAERPVRREVVAWWINVMLAQRAARELGRSTRPRLAHLDARLEASRRATDAL